MSLKKAIKRAGLSVLIFPKKIKGYTVRNAKLWCRVVYRDFRGNKHKSIGKKLWAYRRGFRPNFVENHGINKDNVSQYISERDYYYVQSINGTYAKWIRDHVTTRKVLDKFSYLMPDAYYHFYMRGTEVSIKKLKQLPEGYEETFDDVLRFIRDKKNVILRISKYRVGFERKIHYDTKRKKYYISGQPVTGKELIHLISEKCGKKKSLILMEQLEMHEDFKVGHNTKRTTVQLVVMNESGTKGEIAGADVVFDGGICVKRKGAELVVFDQPDEFRNKRRELLLEVEEGMEEPTMEVDGKVYTLHDKIRMRKIVCEVNTEDGSFCGGKELLEGQIKEYTHNPRDGKEFKGVVPHWKEIQEAVNEICCYLPQLEFFGIDVCITEDGFKFVKFRDMPVYSRVRTFSPKVNAFLKLKLEEKKREKLTAKAKWAEFCRVSRLQWMSFVRACLYPEGIRRRLTLYWIEEMVEDFMRNKEVSFKDKMWAYKHGFLSYRLKQYGITRENYLDYISDLEYLFVRHINNDYKTWLEDKITVKYICRDHKECFPNYYYYVSMRNGESRIIPLMDCPEQYGNTHQDIIQLAKEVGILALKPDQGSWGKGFYRLEYIDQKFYLNFEEATEQEVLELLSDPNTQYLVTEYIQMHHDLKKIYSGSVNTIRMIVYKRDGKNAKIGNAYMRFGSKATGAVDNMRAGGMFARIDIETGRYYDAKILENNSIVDRECHPDTGVKIEGILPNWEKVKSLVLDIANSIDQLEYFGFDIAITEDGIKLPEINRYPGFPRIETFNRDTIDYLLERLMEKEKQFGYDKKLPHKFIKLQDRTNWKMK